MTSAQAPSIEAECSNGSSDQRPPVLTIGYLVLDVVTGDGAVQSRSAGGTSGNVAANLAWLGVDVGVVGRIGTDVAGDLVVRDLRSQGVGIKFLQRDSAVETPMLIHCYDRSGSPRYLKACPTCGRKFASYRPPTVEQAADAFETAPMVMFADRASLATIAAMEATRNRGGVVFFEPNGPGRPHLTKKAIELAGILKISQDRLPLLEDMLSDDSEQVQIITMGGRGLRFRKGAGSWSHQTPHPAPMLVDSGGAGDWVSAGLIHHLVIQQQGDIRDGLRFGQALAALSCGYPGAHGLNRAMPADAAIRWIDGLDKSMSAGRHVQYPSDLVDLLAGCVVCV